MKDDGKELLNINKKGNETYLRFFIDEIIHIPFGQRSNNFFFSLPHCFILKNIVVVARFTCLYFNSLFSKVTGLIECIQLDNTHDLR